MSLPTVEKQNNIEPDSVESKSGDSLEEPIPIRAHTLLCLQGYKGLGYCAEFIAMMDRVHRILNDNPNLEVKVLAGADIFCEVCPHHHRGRCMIDDPEDQPVPFDSPDNAVIMDRRVLQWLDLKEGEIEYWGSVLYRIGKNVDSSVMDILCGNCRWREYGYCAKALDDLNAGMS